MGEKKRTGPKAFKEDLNAINLTSDNFAAMPVEDEPKFTFKSKNLKKKRQNKAAQERTTSSSIRVENTTAQLSKIETIRFD